jgi:hypothetical protein
VRIKLLKENKKERAFRKKKSPAFRRDLPAYAQFLRSELEVRTWGQN